MGGTQWHDVGSYEQVVAIPRGVELLHDFLRIAIDPEL